MWIDPLEVSYRIGENGSICVLYEHKASKKETTTDPSQPEAWRPTSTSNSTSSTATVVVSNASGMHEYDFVSEFFYILITRLSNRFLINIFSC